jgi:hypothetical protein
MRRHFSVLVEDRVYEAIAVTAAYLGRAVIISISSNGSEVGRIKLVSSMLTAVLKAGNLDEWQFLEAACSQFLERQLATQVLLSPKQLLEIDLV